MFKETKILMHSDKISKTTKLIVFSDIHFSGNHDIKKLEKLIEKVKTYEVDYICIPGDIVDEPSINCDYLVKIPMVGHVNSLNASVSAGIMISALVNQSE